ncbi:hypothetical protein [Dongia sedimenti]|uniref:Apea-like HEPN domain-containing protein n=1 Tax=Dongia sedimenti TaxID=3064282 RepID=A0ABU0YW05_9PROT|nr:hypothetical protein [Rhodospirillaceae bacterium R-7]
MNEDVLDELAGALFRTFARFEYALKAAGFHCGDGEAKADWTAFAKSIPTVFDDPQDDGVKEAVAYILAHPPKKQVVAGGLLGWAVADPGNSPRSDQALVYVRRVRNNLFHGGKFNGRWIEPQRSEELLRHSLAVLRACLEASAKVRAAYDG